MPGSSALTEFLIDKEDGRSTVRLFVASPTPLEENNLGKLFAVMEVESNESFNNDILDVIAHTMNTHYYQSETFEIESAFEFALQKTNNKLQELISEIGEEWLGQLNIIVGVQKDKKLIFTHLGKVIAMMVHKGNSIDVVDSAQSKAQDINPVKIFSQVVSGEVPPTSILILATESILNYLSKEKIKRVLLDHEPEFAVKEFHSLLSEDTTNTNFGALIIKREAEEITTPNYVVNKTVYAPSVRHGSKNNDSMIELRGKEDQTEELLTPSIWPSLKKTMQQAITSVGPKKGATAEDGMDETDSILNSEPSPVSRARTSHRRPQSLDKKAVAHFVSRSMQLLSSLAQASVSAGKMVGSAVMSRNRKMNTGAGATRRSFRRPSTTSIGDTLGHWFSNVVQWFQSLTLIQKSFFIVAVVVFLIFAQSVISRGEQKVTSDQEQQFAQTIAEIDIKVSDGNAALLYDKEAARKSFSTAQDLLNTIPKESKTYKSRGEELSRVITDQLRIANGVFNVENPTAAADFSSVSSNVGQIILLGRSLYGFDENSSGVYRHNLEDQKTSVAYNPDDSTPAPIAVSKASVGTGVSVMKNQTFRFFSPLDDAFSPLALSYSNTKRTIIDIAVYGTRLYTLDTENNQIFRHQKSGDNTFGAGSGWITDSKIDIKEASSFAIDGSIYVLLKNGQVQKFSGGKKDGFSVAAVDPALDSATQIFTEETAKNIYVLDPSDKRMVVFDKTGKLVAQYTSASFDNLKDLVVDEPNKTAYLLNGTKVFTVTLQ